jgi:predicted TIM-barrel fold metal-dependent hydrolase
MSMRIDAHTHPHVMPANPADAAAYRSRSEAAGIGGIVLMGCPCARGMEAINAEIFSAVATLGDFVIPVPVVDMDHSNPDEVHRLFERGARGIKFIRPDHAYRDERYFPLYEAVKARGGVAVFHTGYLMHTPDYDPQFRTGMDDMRPGHLDAVLRWVPHLKVLMSHFGNPYWDECWKVMISHPTVFADLSGGTAIHRSMFFWKEMFAPNGRLAEDALAKLCFGTDLSYFFEGGALDPRLAQYIDFHERLFEQVGAPAALREQVNVGNIRSLFGR